MDLKDKIRVIEDFPKPGISFKDVTTLLRGVDRALFEDVESVLQKNKMERHLRGGEATKKKYQRQSRCVSAENEVC